MHTKSIQVVFATLVVVLLATAVYAEIYNSRYEKVSNAPVFCPEVVTPARNLETKKIKDFPNTCIPEGWERIAPIPIKSENQ